MMPTKGMDRWRRTKLRDGESLTHHHSEMRGRSLGRKGENRESK